MYGIMGDISNTTWNTMNDNVVMMLNGNPVIREKADEVLEHLRPREQYIMKSRFPSNPALERMTFSEIGERVGLKSGPAYNMYKKGVKRTAFYLETDQKTAEIFLSLAVPGWMPVEHEALETMAPGIGKKLDYIDRCLRTANSYGLNDRDKEYIKHALEWALIKQPRQTDQT
jgi:hypothetical protein